MGGTKPAVAVPGPTRNAAIEPTRSELDTPDAVRPPRRLCSRLVTVKSRPASPWLWCALTLTGLSSIPPPRKDWHRYHGVCAPNHSPRPAVTAMAIGNVGKQRDATSSFPLRPGEGRGKGATSDKPHPHDTSWIAWAKLMARMGERRFHRRARGAAATID